LVGYLRPERGGGLFSVSSDPSFTALFYPHPQILVRVSLALVLAACFLRKNKLSNNEHVPHKRASVISYKSLITPTIVFLLSHCLDCRWAAAGILSNLLLKVSLYPYFADLFVAGKSGPE
jgi:hypothetical protein